MEHLHEMEEAQMCFDAALWIDQNYAPAWTNKGLVLKEMEALEEAEKCLNVAKRIDPECAKAMKLTGYLSLM
jgi:tetratricopeptide (TPR) repeat protein